jgi:hypothetical protein
MVHTVLKQQLVISLLQKHAISSGHMPSDMINKPRKIIQDIIHNTYQPTDTTKKDKAKTVLALINELQL